MFILTKIKPLQHLISVPFLNSSLFFFDSGIEFLWVGVCGPKPYAVEGVDEPVGKFCFSVSFYHSHLPSVRGQLTVVDYSVGIVEINPMIRIREDMDVVILNTAHIQFVY